jgi:hypothetical protein
VHLAVIYDVYKRSKIVVGSRRGAPLSSRGMRGMHDCEECTVAIFTPAARNPLIDLSEMNIRSAPFHKESTWEISSPYAEAFDMIKRLKNSNKK